MGFGREARRVRDSSLPVRFRLNALCSCIQMVQPIGFNATWSYLQEKTGRPWRDPEFLLPAIVLLEAERALHLAAAAEYTALRRERKAAGYRFPPRDDVTPTSPRRWHGDEKLGAIHALRTWRRLRSDQAVADHPQGRIVVAEVDRVLAAPAPAASSRELQPILDWARRQIWVIGWEADASELRIAGVLHHLLGQLYLAANGATPVATPWRFTEG